LARQRKGRPVNGLFLLDKPSGITSNDALQRVRRLFQAQKAGHTGALDPLASGMLPICLGEATKFSQYLLDADKLYQVRARLGERTASGDADSECVEKRPVPELDEQKLEAVLARFRGTITQVPPMYSALKHQGQPLYKLARQGVEIERKARVQQIDELVLLELGEEYFSLRVRCSKGTYIRSLVEDIGEVLGCGAHVVTLRRLAVAGFEGLPIRTLESLAHILEEQGSEGIDALLLPEWQPVAQLPRLQLSHELARYVRLGQAVFVPNHPLQGLVGLFEQNDGQEQRFLGVGQMLEDGRVAPKRLVSCG